MTRKHCRRRTLVPMPPRGLRPKLAADQVRDLGMAHTANLDTIAAGGAGEEVLWQWVGGLFTWANVAALLGIGVPEITPQLGLAAAVIERYGRTGRVGFSGPEYQLAKTGVMIMDTLAEQVDRETAIVAAEMGEAQVNKLAAECAQRKQRAA